MNFLQDVKSLDKLLNHDWKSLVYGEQAETWREKLNSVAGEAWSQILTFLESRGRQLQNYWSLYAAFFVGSFVIFVTYKSLRYVGSFKLRNPDNRERQANREISTEESRIISNDGNDDPESLVEELRPVSRSDLCNATAIEGDNDYLSRHDSSVSSNTTIVVAEGKETGEFLRNLINSITPGDDAVSIKNLGDDTEENKEIPDLPESTRQKVDSNNCKQFYVLTPWIGPSEPVDHETRAELLLTPPSIPTSTTIEPSVHQNPTAETVEREEKNAVDHSELGKSGSPEFVAANVASADEEKSTRRTTTESANSTLATHHESSSVCCADELLSRISDTGEILTSSPNTEKPEDSSAASEKEPDSLERVFSNIVQQLPELDLSPISREPLKLADAIDIAETGVRTDSRHRFRSLSHDHRPATNAGYIEARRGSSVSPPARNKNKQRSDRQMQSRIPTPSPLTHRQMQRHLGADGTAAETANQIRSVLLRKLKEVWEQYPRDTTPSPDRFMDVSHNSSVYYTPENVSRIPLLRRSPRDASDSPRSPRVDSRSDRLANPTGQSRPGYSGITNERGFPADASAVPMHSTPKTSPLSRGGNHRR